MSALGKLLAAVLALAALTVGHGAWQAHQQRIGEQRATARYTGAIDRQKRDAAAQLAAETARAGAATQALQDFKNHQEKKDAQNQSAVDGLAARLRAAAGAAGRLRDPNAARCGGGGGGAPAADPARAGGGAADDADAGGLFSAGATELLQRLTVEADAVNIAYASCRADAMNLRQALQ